MPPQTSRFFTTNWAHGATVMNGTGGAPARNEDADWPMENALTRGRGTPWFTSATPDDPQYFDIGLGALRSIYAVGIAGFEGAAGGISFPNRAWIQYAADATYPPAAWSYFAVPDLSLSGQPRDPGVVLPGPVGARWVRYWFENTFGSHRFGAGHFFLGGPPADMGRAYSPGALRDYRHERHENPTMDRTPVKSTVGRDHVDEAFQFNHLDSAELAKVVSVFSAGGPIIYFTPFGQMKEMDLRALRVEHNRGDAANDDFAAALDLEHLG